MGNRGLVNGYGLESRSSLTWALIWTLGLGHGGGVSIVKERNCEDTQCHGRKAVWENISLKYANKLHCNRHPMPEPKRRSGFVCKRATPQI